MLINLSDVLSNEGRKREIAVPVEIQEFEFLSSVYPVVDSSDIRFTLENIGIGKVAVSGSFQISFRSVCDRCLEDVTIVINPEFSLVALAPDVNATFDDDEVDLIDLEGYSLNVETLIRDEILINWPMKILCREDCKGICPVCGQNLNLGDCGCDTFVPDPRMAAFKDIFNANKEV